MNTIQARSNARSQHGAALVVSLIMLLIMTILALSMSQTTRMHERMAGNSRDYDLAFQAGESALRSAEAEIRGLPDKPDLCPTSTAAKDSCHAVEKGGLLIENIDLREENEDWWKDNAKPYGTPAQELTDVARDPFYVAEKVGTHKIDGLAIGRGQPPERDFYKITANAVGRGETTRVIVESVVAAEPR
jgi:type IV pilus assembly protein PilX